MGNESLRVGALIQCPFTGEIGVVLQAWHNDFFLVMWAESGVDSTNMRHVRALT